MSLYDEYHNEYLGLVKVVGTHTAELLQCNPFTPDAHLKPCKAIDAALSEAMDVVRW
jgi:hypothetical protein